MEKLPEVWSRISTAISGLGGLNSQFLSTLIGAVVGAVVAGLISLGIQIYGARAIRKERLAAKRQEDLATSFSTSVKVIKMMSNIWNFRSAIDHALSRLKEPGLAGLEPWQVVPPFGNLPPAVTFTEAEAAFLLSTKVKDLILTALELAEVHNDFVRLVAAYSERREALTAFLPAHEVEGSWASTDLTQEELRKLKPRTIPLGMLLDTMRERAVTDYKQAKLTFDLLKAHCEERFGKDFPNLELDERAIST